MFWGVHLFLCSVLASKSLLSFVRLRVHVTYSYFSFFVIVTHHPRKGRARNYHEKNSKAEHRARESPRLGSEGDEDLDEEVEKEEEERKTHSYVLMFPAQRDGGKHTAGSEKSDKAPTNKICRRASSEQRPRTRSCHESEHSV